MKRIIVIRVKRTGIIDMDANILESLVRRDGVFDNDVSILYHTLVEEDKIADTVAILERKYKDTNAEDFATFATMTSNTTSEMGANLDILMMDYYKSMLYHVAKKEYIQQLNIYGIDVHSVALVGAIDSETVNLSTGEYTFVPIIVKSNYIKSIFRIVRNEYSELNYSLRIDCEEMSKNDRKPIETIKR